MRGCILEVNSAGLGDGVIDSMFLYHFVDFDLRVEHFISEKKLIQISRKCLLSYCFFSDKKAFKSSLDLYFHPSIALLSSEWKKRNIPRLLEALEKGFFWERLGRGSRTLLSPVKLYGRIWKWKLDQNLYMALLIVAVCTVLF